MAKNSRKRIGMARAVLALALPVCSAAPSAATAGGLPLRAGAAPHVRAHDQALAGLAENLDFKLGRFDRAAPPADTANWTAMVEETLLIADRLGCAPESPVTPQRIGQTYAVILEGDSFVAGADPDRVLGRLLYMLAHADPFDGQTRTAAALSVLDQPLSATLAALPLTSSP